MTRRGCERRNGPDVQVQVRYLELHIIKSRVCFPHFPPLGVDEGELLAGDELDLEELQDGLGLLCGTQRL